ncbi:MAG: acetyl-CoA carboxylase carboxyltransferase subunit alpha [Clostridiaceae bacterium]|nr:acetyl-CoA carboxylase carboxyltransferase subunit alpha [Clostridiaceae bacterium]
MEISAWGRVQNARSTNRPTSQYYIKNMFSNFLEFHGDRLFRDDPSIIGGIGQIGDFVVTVIAEEKGVTLEEKSKRNFGSPHPEGYRKALRLMRQAEKFNRPIITLVDTQGAYCGVGAEERGQGEAIAQNLREMFSLSVPIISVIIGEGGSGGALAIAVANKVYMLENAVYSILSPEGFSSILWKDSSRAAEAAELMKMTSYDLLNMNIIDGVIEEPNGGAHVDPEATLKLLKEKIMKDLEYYKTKSKEEILSERYERFRKF